MIVVNADNSIYLTRGDTVAFSVSASFDDVPYEFQAGDVVCLRVFEKKNCDNVVFQKDFPVLSNTGEIQIILTEDETRIGEVIDKPVDYWYEIELNPDSIPQTIIGYDEDGAKIFKLFPEGKDVSGYIPTEEDIPYVDQELDATSERPVANHAATRAIIRINSELETIFAEIEKIKTHLNIL